MTPIAAQTAGGLEAAYAKGIIHRGIKPENLMVTHDGTVKILDFGVPRFTSEVDRTQPRGLLTYTVAYLTPGQAQEESIGPPGGLQLDSGRHARRPGPLILPALTSGRSSDSRSPDTGQCSRNRPTCIHSCCR